MAFWGVEVRPGKPFTHVHDDAKGRLRLSQATLGMGKGTTRSVLQCNIGKKSPILLCSLIPDRTESCHLELEFEEAEDVIFSVIGQKSVHLSGYYIGSGRGNDGDESDSYGEDLGEEDSENDGIFYNDDEDEYESDFIDDGDLGMFPPSPKRKKSGVVIEDILDDDKPANGNGKRRRLKKKNQLSDTDDGEDGFPISPPLKNKNDVKKTEENKSGDKIVDEDGKRKIDAATENVRSERETSPDNSLLSLENNTATKDTLKKKKKVRGDNHLETTSVPAAVDDVSSKLEQDVGDNNGEEKQKERESSTGVEIQATEKDGKSNKKKKEKAKKRKTQEESADGSFIMMEETEDAKDAKTPVDMNQDQPLERELNEIIVGSNEKLKKKKKKKVNNDIAEGMSNDKKIEAEKDNKLVESLPKNKLIKVVSDDTNAAQSESKKKSKNKEEKAEPQKTRTLANGLVIEELSLGKPNGKKSSRQ